MLPDNLIELINSGKYSEEDLEGEIYYWESYGDQIGRVADNISVEGNSLYIEGLTEDIYNELNRHMYRWLEDFANDLDAELVDEEYLDEGLENAKYGIIETKKFNNKNFKSFRPVETLEDAKWQKDSLEKVDKIPYTIFTIEDKKKVEESLHNDEIDEYKNLSKEIGLKTLGDLKTFKDHQGSAELDALKDYKKELDLDEALGLNEGISGNMTVEDIAKKHNVPVEDIKAQLEKGIKVEKEHTNDESKAERIALDHLFEIPNYYDKLDKIEKSVLKESNDYSYETIKNQILNKNFSKKLLLQKVYNSLTRGEISKTQYKELVDEINSKVEESLQEDTIKQNGKWVNKGKEGTHGTFKTKKAADAQRKAMFANSEKNRNFGENLKEDAEKPAKDLIEKAKNISDKLDEEGI